MDANTDTQYFEPARERAFDVQSPLKRCALLAFARRVATGGATDAELAFMRDFARTDFPQEPVEQERAAFAAFAELEDLSTWKSERGDE